MALMALNIGVGDAVITTPFTFIATAEVISLIGAIPLFADIDPRTCNLEPSSLEKVITNRNLKPKAIIAVDLYGLPSDYDRIGEIAEKYGIFVIEDAAQSFGGEVRGKKTCSFGHIACTSFFPAKPLGCYGDGGMCFTDNDELDAVLDSIRVHGKGGHKYDNIRIGINGRLDTLQAAILLAKFDLFSEEVRCRNEVACRYTEFFNGNENIEIPFIPPGYTSVWAQYSVLATDTANRSRLMANLKDADVPTAIYYPKPLHLQTAFAGLGYKKGDFPVSENCAERVFSIPMHPYLTKGEQEKIADVISKSA